MEHKIEEILAQIHSLSKRLDELERLARPPACATYVVKIQPSQSFKEDKSSSEETNITSLFDEEDLICDSSSDEDNWAYRI